ncbi:hypothetical protein GFH30_03465 [Acinetobacter wanghuae]|uniref:Uncharacterized protein n=1 Tax=Acinetobacter wanghuae TaxID=2662362 RepID=A0A5Q0P174_9GAMM|nr:hypothetical protein [Acinetobacter wanghuae]MQW92273.1 hypothetical protein [Acinetobacter wanghuae]QGA10514.1 hypothetical protein GFH30_03465 [Acinetobacter wanghuae]
MSYLISDSNSTVKQKTLSTLNLALKEVQYNELIQEKTNYLIIVIDRDLTSFKDIIIRNVRASQYVIGVWSTTALTSYLPKDIKDLLDSLLCEDNIVLIPSLIQSYDTIIQLPDCSEEEIKDIKRVNCKTGKRL